MRGQRVTAASFRATSPTLRLASPSAVRPFMDTPRLHPLTLRFTPTSLEAAFGEDYTRRSLLLVRWALVLGLVQYATFGILDPLMVPDSFEAVRVIRIGVCAFLGLAIGYTFAPSFPRRMQPVLASVALVGGFGVVAMTAVAQSPNGYYDYYAGVMLLLVYVHVLLRLRFVVASAVGAVIIGAYLAAAVLARTPGALLLNDVLFLTSVNFSGMVASYALERYARIECLRARQQAESNAVLTDALNRLRTTQAQLVQQEKMAGLG